MKKAVPDQCHFAARLRDRYGLSATPQVLAEIRNLIVKSNNPRRRGKQVLLRGHPLARRQVWRVFCRQQWITVVWDRVERRLVTALSPEEES